MDRRWRNLLPSRRRRFDVPVSPPATTAPVVPRFIGRGAPRSFALARRGVLRPRPWFNAAATQQQAPAVVRQSRRPALPSRRGKFALPPWPQQAPPPPPLFVPRQGRRPGADRTLYTARGQFASPPVPPPPGPGPLAPRLIRQTTRKVAVTRRGLFVFVPQRMASSFLCQDFSAAATIDAYSGTATVDTYSATAYICGR